MTDEQAEKLIDLLETKILPRLDKIDAISELVPMLETLGEILVFRKHEADEIFSLNKQTLSKSKKAETFEEVGARKVYVDLKSLRVYRSKNRKKR